MMNHWAIIIGINQYRNIQPLMYAQQDAQGLKDFLVHEAGFLPERCVTLTDSSPSLEEESTFPTREQIQAWLTRICDQQIQADDLLWVFFSGYGAHFEGQDYLMPIDGDLNAIPETAISIQQLFDTLQATETDNLFVVLDMSRVEAAISDQHIGTQTAELAGELGIPTLLSCQPDSFSRETIALEQGLFTAALLEGLRHNGCATISQLVEYLNNRLPELSRHHSRPPQVPLAIIPEEQKHLMIVPIGEKEATAPMTEAAAFDQPMMVDEGEDLMITSAEGYEDDETPFESEMEELDESEPMLKADEEQVESAGVEADEERDGFWGQVTSWGIVFVLLLFLGVFLRNQPIFTALGNRQSEPEATADAGAPDVAADTPAATAENSATTPEAVEDEAAEQPGLLNRVAAFFSRGEDTTAPDAEAPGDSAVPAATPDADDTESADADGADAGTTVANATAGADTAVPETTEPSATEPSAPEPADATANGPGLSARITSLFSGRTNDEGEAETATSSGANSTAVSSAADASALGQAQKAVAAQQYEAALTWLEQVPVGQRSQAYEALKSKAQQGVEQVKRTNQIRLSGARALIRPSQASYFSAAIAEARQIKPGQPFYEEAQQDIDRWSQVILDLAEGRAAEGKFDSAIAAAQLVPQDRTVFAEAQQRIAQWQQQQANRLLLEEASWGIQRGQAHSFQAAINTARQIKVGEPEYTEAQRLVNEWSQNILAIARARATRGEIISAIQAAELVPADTTVYAEAQQDIQTWQSQI
ncbi:MAG: hypothetical protein F6K19_20740 [Cyanothece sp. SIO1E1]|nr:hypothetical protein [Cyanothece sp. SIO1E1]